jgi:hypothetical protein
MLMRLVATVMVASGLSATGAAPAEMAATFRGTIAWLAQPVLVGDSTGMMSGTLSIEIQRWSTEAERQALVSALATGQPEEALAALNAPRPPVGRVVLTGPLLLGNDGNEPVPMDIHYATENRQPNGVRRVSLLVRSGGGRGSLGRTDWVELEVQPDGTGKGTGSFACKVGLNKEGTDIALRTPGTRSGVIRLLK